jgi:hypothetical protein
VGVHTDHGEACPRLSSPHGRNPRLPGSPLSRISLPLCKPTCRSTATRQHTPRVHAPRQLHVDPGNRLCPSSSPCTHACSSAAQSSACYSAAQSINQSSQQIAPDPANYCSNRPKSRNKSPSIKETGTSFHGEHLRSRLV